MDARVIDLAPGELLEGLSLVEVLDPTMLARIFRLRVEAYNTARPHSAIHGLTPWQRVNNLLGNDT